MTAMGEGGKEPSMEHILSSIKRIIAEDGDAQAADRRERRPKAPINLQRHAAPDFDDPEEGDVLELNSDMSEPDTDEDPASLPSPQPEVGETLLSKGAAEASRCSLDQLSRMVVRPEVAGTDTLEGMVREMLRPMLAQWLEENLPRVVDAMVEREIARITGK